jgi:hypothetical protein
VNLRKDHYCTRYTASNSFTVKLWWRFAAGIGRCRAHAQIADYSGSNCSPQFAHTQAVKTSRLTPGHTPIPGPFAPFQPARLEWLRGKGLRFFLLRTTKRQNQSWNRCQLLPLPKGMQSNGTTEYSLTTAFLDLGKPRLGPHPAAGIALPCLVFSAIPAGAREETQ